MTVIMVAWGRDDRGKVLVRILEESGYEGEGWEMDEGGWMAAG